MWTYVYLNVYLYVCVVIYVMRNHGPCLSCDVIIKIRKPGLFGVVNAGQLAYQHRWLVEEQLSNFDYFISIEDDMRRTHHFTSHHTQQLQKLVLYYVICGSPNMYNLPCSTDFGRHSGAPHTCCPLTHLPPFCASVSPVMG